MTKLKAPIIVTTLASLLLANPLSDTQNQRNSLFQIPGHTINRPNAFRMTPIQIRLRDNAGLSCPKEGFYMDTRNCSRFYRCVDVASTGYFSIFNFECPTGQVFYEDSNSCVPGICPTGSTKPVNPPTPSDTPQQPWAPPSVNPPPSDTPQQPWAPPSVNPPPSDTPQQPWAPPSVNPPPSDTPQQPWAPPSVNPPPSDTPQLPWAPPSVNPPPSDTPQQPWAPPSVNPPPSDTPQQPWAPPPVNPSEPFDNPTDALSPSPPPSPQTSEENSESETNPQWLYELPPWFKETPWWFKTPPAWFHQPPAWFNAPPASSIVIDENITVGDNEATPDNTGNIIKTFPGNVSVEGINHGDTLTDNKTIRIHIPIHIVQQ